MKTSHSLMYALIAYALGGTTLPVLADAADDWVRYRLANHLPVEAEPSRPDQLPRDEGPVPAPPELIPDIQVSIEGGHGLRHCDDEIMIEMARTDGDPGGTAARCW